MKMNKSELLSLVLRKVNGLLLDENVESDDNLFDIGADDSIVSDLIYDLEADLEIVINPDKYEDRDNITPEDIRNMIWETLREYRN